MPTLILIGLAFALIAASPVRAVESAVLEAEQKRVDVIQAAAKAVVAVFAAEGKGGGSGVIISPDGFALTNFHVVEGQGVFLRCGLNDGRLYHAVLAGIDPTGDLAVIKLLGRDDFPHATIADSDTVQVGDWTYAMGNPFLLAADFQPTISYGIVSGTHRYQEPAGTFLDYTDCLQVDTSINPGNSGGPLFNDQGELIGINGRIAVDKRGRVNVGAGYAISINQAMNFLDHLKSGRVVDHATLGALVTSSSDGAVVVSAILPASEAYRRGLRVGDELVSFAGRPIRSVNQFKNILGIYPKGWKLPLSYRREGKKEEVLVRLRALHRADELRLRKEPKEQPPERKAPNKKKEKSPPEDKQPDELQPKPNPTPKKAHQDPEEPPAEFAGMFIEKKDYINYYFNKLAREKISVGLSVLGDYQGVDGLWTLSGKTADGKDFQIKLGDEVVGMLWANKPFVQKLNADFTEEPTGSGGLLAALHHLKQMLVHPDAYFNEVAYEGSEPIEGEQERADVLVATRGAVATRFYFAKTDHRWLGLDTAVQEDIDECEIRVLSLGDFSGRKFPKHFTIHCGGKLFSDFQVETLTFAPKTAKTE